MGGEYPPILLRKKSAKKTGQKFNIPFGYHLLTISLTIDKQIIILVKEILTK